jgi:hypothetical protein
VFPAPELVYTDIYMVGVPYFLEELLCVQARTSPRQKKPVTLTPPWVVYAILSQLSLLTPPPAPPQCQHLWGGICGVGDVEFVQGPNGAHCFIVVASLAHIVVIATHINGHINSNKYIFF